MVARFEVTLSEAARLLGERQHRLIHLCEKGVVVPDLADAKGRGSSRRFSARNLLEFSLALRMRDAMIPVAASAAVVQVLRTFDRILTKEVRAFSLPGSLRTANSPDLRIILSDGRHLYFTLGFPGRTPKVFDGIDIGRLRLDGGKVRGAPRNLAETTPVIQPRGAFGAPEGSKHIRVEISVTQIARDLPLG